MRKPFLSNFDFAISGWTYSKQSPIAFEPDGVGVQPVFFEPLLVTTTDTIPDDITTAETLTVDGAHVISTLDTIGDQDFFSVTLTAGVQYQIGMYGYVGGPSLTPLADSYVEIYDAGGNLIVSGDGGADTPLNIVNSGFDVLLSFTPTTSGTYYIDARAFDNLPADGTDGDLVGDYEVFVQTAPPGAYTPYYDPDSPLYAIDWGTRVNRVNQSAANPDGDEGTRDTGNPQGMPGVSPETAALAAAQGIDIAGTNVITIYFAQAGDIFTSLEDPTSPGLPPATITAVGVQQFERDAVFTSLEQFSSVSDIVYIEVDNRDDADFIYTSYQGTPGPGVSLLGSMAPPDEPNEGLAQFNSGDERWNATNLQQGGFSFVTLIHEFGHGHGLAHPHDNGGQSGIMRGVEEESPFNYTTGDFELNQGVFTMMSYEDGWQSSPYGNAPTDVGYGYLGGLMAFDIAVIQDRYGVNEEWATGDDVYVIPDENAPGTFFSCIWDAAGTDSIVYGGVRDCVIDLRAATLQYEPGGGGWVSHADGIFGGFTIANGASIENATSGAGLDLLMGNSADNALSGLDAADTLMGLGGNDTLTGGNGHDSLIGGYGRDTLSGGEGHDTLNGEERTDLVSYASATGRVFVSLNRQGMSQDTGADGHDTLIDIENLEGSTFNDRLTGNEFSNVLDGAGGNDYLYGGGEADELIGGLGNDRLIGEGGADFLQGGAGDDLYILHDPGDFADTVDEASNEGDDTVFVRFDYTLGSNLENLELGSGDFIGTGNELDNRIRAEHGENALFGLGGNDLLIGDTGRDALDGGAGDDRLFGGANRDTLTGGEGNDRFTFESLDAAGTDVNGGDIITDFGAGDRIDLGLIDANSATGEDDAFTFVGTEAFTGTAGELRYYFDGGRTVLEMDVDGDGVGDAFVRLEGQTDLVAGDFFF